MSFLQRLKSVLEGIQVPQPERPAWRLQKELERRISWEDEIEYDEEEGSSSFKGTGYSGVQCTGYACLLYSRYPGRVKIYGFEEEQSAFFRKIRSGHDFAVFDDRFVVDPWIKEVEGVSDRIVFDLQSDDDKEAIEYFYGDVAGWERMLEIEQSIK